MLKFVLGRGASSLGGPHTPGPIRAPKITQISRLIPVIQSFRYGISSTSNLIIHTFDKLHVKYQDLSSCGSLDISLRRLLYYIKCLNLQRGTTGSTKFVQKLINSSISWTQTVCQISLSHLMQLYRYFV